MHPGPNTRKSTANQPWWQCGHHLVGTMWSIKKNTWPAAFQKKTFSNKKKGPRSTGSLLLIFLKKKNQPGTGSPKKIFFKKMWIVRCFPKKLFPTIQKVPTRQQQHVRRLIAFFVKEKKTTRGFLKKSFFKQKNVDRSFQKNLFPTKRKVPTRRSAMTATARSAE